MIDRGIEEHYIMKKAILYIHGKSGSFAEAEQFKKNCDGDDVIGIDYNLDFPWIVKDKIKSVYDKVSDEYDSVSVIANSISAYFTMLTLQNCQVKKALFISPILDMEKLIYDMMDWAEVTEQELFEKKEISTDFGENLSWDYLQYVKSTPIEWKIQTEILYAGQDTLTSNITLDAFVESHNAKVTIMENGEHWFHTDEQIAFLDKWMKEAIKI